MDERARPEAKSGEPRLTPLPGYLVNFEIAILPRVASAGGKKAIKSMSLVASNLQYKLG
jgi:hypothetical protein